MTRRALVGRAGGAKEGGGVRDVQEAGESDGWRWTEAVSLGGYEGWVFVDSFWCVNIRFDGNMDYGISAQPDRAEWEAFRAAVDRAFVFAARNSTDGETR